MRISDWSSDVCSSDLPWSSHASSSRAMVGRACAPARAGQRQVGERTLAVTAVAAVEQHWGAPFGGGKLEPPRRGVVGRLYLGDDAGKRPVAQCVFAQGQQFAVVLALRIEDALGPKPGLDRKSTRLNSSH